MCFWAYGDVHLQSKIEYLEIGNLVWLVFGLNCVISTIFTHVDHVKYQYSLQSEVSGWPPNKLLHKDF